MKPSFPVSAADFYKLRDGRTNRCISQRHYHEATCILCISSSCAKTRTAQVIFLVAANLLSRWCRHVTLVAPQVGLHPGLGSTSSGGLVEAALRQMGDADPFGVFDSRTHPPRSRHDQALCVGDASFQLPVGRSVFVSADRWLAGVSKETPPPLPLSGNGNCMGAVAAACLGIGQVFKMALGLPADRLLRDGVFDLFRLEWTQSLTTAPPLRTDVGRLVLVGAGSVGSSAAYCMRLAGVSGKVTIVDKDMVGVENFNRSPIFGRKTFGCPKSEATAAHLARSAMLATAHVDWWNDYIAGQPDRSSLPFDVWLPLANSRGVRGSMQHNVPPIMIHASTTANWGVNHGRHVPGVDDCLADRFPNEAGVDALACATVASTENEEQIDAALPFCSLFAGLLVTAELLRLNLPGPQIPNFALLDWYGTMDGESIQKSNRVPRDDCFCRQQGRELHKEFNGTTRHWPNFGFGGTG